MSSLKEHNCSKVEKVPNLSLDKETNFTNLDDSVSINELATSSRDGFDANSIKKEQAMLSRDGFKASSNRNEATLSSEVNNQPKKKSLKIKRRAHQVEDEVAVLIKCPAKLETRNYVRRLKNQILI